MSTSRPTLAQALSDDRRAFECSAIPLPGSANVERVCAVCDWINRSSLRAPRRLCCHACKAELERRVGSDRNQGTSRSAS